MKIIEVNQKEYQILRGKSHDREKFEKLADELIAGDMDYLLFTDDYFLVDQRKNVYALPIKGKD